MWLGELIYKTDDERGFSFRDGKKNYKEKFYEKEKEIVCFECVLYEYDELYK